MKRVGSRLVCQLFLAALVVAGLSACTHKPGDQACNLPSSHCEDTYPGNNY